MNTDKYIRLIQADIAAYNHFSNLVREAYNSPSRKWERIKEALFFIDSYTTIAIEIKVENEDFSSYLSCFYCQEPLEITDTKCSICERTIINLKPQDG